MRHRVSGLLLAGVLWPAISGMSLLGQMQGLSHNLVTEEPAGGTTDTLQNELNALATAHHGHVAMYARQLNTGKTVAIDANKPVQTASVIKLTILFEAMEQIRAGNAHWDEKLTLAKGDGVSGSGVLTFLDAPLTLTL